jgi:preprotein translocase subunit SecG
MKSMQMVHSFSSGSAETAGAKGAATGAAAGVAVLLTVFVIVFVDIFGKDQTKI